MQIPLEWSVKEILTATGGKLLSGGVNGSYPSLAIDTRTLSRGAIYIAICGETHDGHSFIRNALEKGAAGIIGEHQKLARYVDVENQDQHQIWIGVENTTTALGSLAHYRRRQWNGPLLAITGSNGKTTTRKMLSRIMAQKGPTLSTKGNLNNEIGLPLTLFRISPDHL